MVQEPALMVVRQDQRQMRLKHDERAMALSRSTSSTFALLLGYVEIDVAMNQARSET